MLAVSKIRATEPRPNDVIVVPPGGVDLVDKPRQDVLLGADLLNGHDVELADDFGQQLRDPRIAKLLLAENLDVERRHVNRVAIALDAGQI